MHIIDGAAAALPSEVHPAEADAPRPTAQWLAHHNAIFDLAWFQVGLQPWCILSRQPRLMHLSHRQHYGAMRCRAAAPAPTGVTRSRPPVARQRGDAAGMMRRVRCAHTSGSRGIRDGCACACGRGAQDDKRMLTASGDQCLHLWDTATARGLGQFRGHNGSVKSVCPHASHHAIFASGKDLSCLPPEPDIASWLSGPCFWEGA